MSKLKELNPTPLYDAVIPSTGKKIKYRPFFVREERALLAAQETEDSNVMLNTMEQVINNCIVTQYEEELSTFDLEYMFVQVRMRSLGEESALVFTCKNDKCQEKTIVNLALKNVYVKVPEGHTKMIRLSETLAVQMKYPTVEELTLIDDSNGEELARQLAITSSIDTIYNGLDTIVAKDVNPDELTEFVEEMTGEQYKKFLEFFNTIPSTQYDLKWSCPKCGQVHEQTLEGLSSFF